MKEKNVSGKNDKIRLMAIIMVSLFVVLTGILYLSKALGKGDIAGAILGGIIAVIILIFAFFVYKRGSDDLKNGLPIHDERSRRVMEKASSKAFYVSLYMLLGVGLLSENIIVFRDVSQATGISVGCMAILFAVFWAYYNSKEI
ncbi:MAG: DUF2178 domain-containing protein [archaeon]